MSETVDLPCGVVLRSVREDDAPAMHDALLRNREHLMPFEADRPESYWTLDGQRDRLRMLLRKQADGELVSRVIVDGAKILGYASLNALTPRPVCGAAVGYWVDAAASGRGLATAAVGDLLRIAGTLGVHRVEAGTSPSNLASQRVLTKNGFERYGTAHSHLYLDGAWQDSFLFERILDDRPPAGR
ncbi:GNAT family protein [Actinoplanes sp. NEAU-A12]|uniref:GNAT family protein n=1 Tax=Actinoplanes sandaracinus TaxID=3045177 RepID=A0ABT6WHT5_9ACTN|nr:GNAT family protein [Actinoplanes sandaracinus]MDI6099297.1 GNAT family protein [Actinoplanes sandaracinus]